MLKRLAGLAASGVVVAFVFRRLGIRRRGRATGSVLTRSPVLADSATSSVQDNGSVEAGVGAGNAKTIYRRVLSIVSIILGGWQGIALWLVALVSLLATLWLSPPSENISRLSARFGITVANPAVDKDFAHSLYPRTVVNYQESHKPGNVVETSVFVIWDQPAPRDLPIELQIQLPYGGEVATSKPCGTGKTYYENDCTIIPADGDEVPVPELHIDGTLRKGSNAHLFSAKLVNCPGIGFKVTHSHVETHLPGWFLLDSGKLPTQPQIEALYFIDDADKYSWSDTPPAYFSSGEAKWNYAWTEDPPAGAVGVREDVVAEDARNTFLAGALIGVCGGAVIGALQTAFELASQRRVKARQLLTQA